MTEAAATTNDEIALPATARAVTRDAGALSGSRKAAIVCLSLGDEVTAELFKYLNEDEVQLISRELAMIQNIPSDTAEGVLAEFHQSLLARSFVITGGIDFAKRLLVRAYGPELAKRLLDKICRSIESSAGFDALQKIDPQQLSKLFQNEHPQTIAVVLAHLDASTAADTIRLLPEEQRTDIALRIANLHSISQDVVRRVSVVVDQKLKSVGSFSRQTIGGIGSVAELCNRLDRDVARKILEEIEAADPKIALAVRNMMVTFDDLLLVDDVGIREVLKRIERKMLSLALKGTIPELQERFYSNMSTKAAEALKEEMEFMGQVKLKDVTGAQREIVEVLRGLEEEGLVSLSGGSSEEKYIA